MERVWGVPRSVLFEILPPFQGFLADSRSLGQLARELDGVGEFRPRPEVEEDPAWKQIIPYVAVTRGERILLLERLSGQGETRLHHRLSIGIGGHVNPEPAGEGTLLERGLRREIQEELEIETFPWPTLLGLINDDSNAVGSVHFGVACRLEVETDVEIRERDLMRGRWIPRADLSRLQPHLESWSRLLYGAITPRIPKPVPKIRDSGAGSEDPDS